MYEELVSHLRECSKIDPVENTYKQAADAIERLQCFNALWQEAAIIAHEREPKWISVTERLPPEWWPVLGIIQFHDEKEPPVQEVLWYLGNGHWRETWRGDMIESAVTHWMPLPEPPKE